MRELVDGLVQSAQNNGMDLYGVHVYRRGREAGREAAPLGRQGEPVPLEY